MEQQKQHKQLILTNEKNIFNCCFQPIQRLQPNFTTDDIRNFITQQKQRKQLILTRTWTLLTVSNQYIAYNLILRLMA